MAPEPFDERVSSDHGRGVFTVTKQGVSTLMFQEREPLVAVLDSPLLTKACAWCFLYSEEASPEDQVKLSACSGCKILRYCGKVRDNDYFLGDICAVPLTYGLVYCPSRVLSPIKLSGKV